MFGKEAKKKELIKNLDALYAQLQREHKINAGDFPDLEKMKKDLVHQDFSKFRGFDKVSLKGYKILFLNHEKIIFKPISQILINFCKVTSRQMRQNAV